LLVDARAVTRPPRPRVIIAVIIAFPVAVAVVVFVVDARRSNPDGLAKAAATVRRRRDAAAVVAAVPR
jgi:heme/copper-type cytochrome/quinol oxidase subunit 2